MKIPLTIFIFSLFICLGNVNGQGSDKLFTSIGTHLAFGSIPIDDSSRLDYFDIGFSYGARYNLLSLSDNIAIGFDLLPSVGLYSGLYFISSTTPTSESGGVLGVSIPALISFNFGAGSTYDSDKDFGFVIKSGLQTDIGPLIVEESDLDLKKVHLYPVIQIGFRFWKAKNNRLKELYFKYGAPSGNENTSQKYRTLTFGGAYLIGY